MKSNRAAGRRWLWGGVLAAAAAGSGIGLWYRDANVKSAAAASKAVLPAPGHAASGSSHAPGAGETFVTASFFPRGMEQEYELHQTTRLSTSAGQAITQIELSGSLKLVGLGSAPNLVVRGEFTGTLDIGAGGNAPGPAGASMTELSHHPFFLEFAEDGAFRGARGDPAVPAMVARVWTALGEYLQLLRQGAGSHWESHESDATGTYVAEYDQGAVREVTKRKLRYESLTSTGFASYDIAWSKIDFQVDSEARLEAYGMEERSRANPGGGPMPAFESASGLTLKRTHVAVEKDQVDAWLAQASTAAPLEQVRQRQDQQARDKQRIASTTVPAVFDALRAFQKANATKAERDKAGLAFAALTSMLREDPSVLETVKKHLEAKGADVETMLAALRDASTPASQKLLADMTLPSSPLSPSDRMEAARSLSRVPMPSMETVQTLKALRSDPDVGIGIQANYGLGSALHRVKDTDPVLAKDVRSTLVSQIETATTEQVRTATLIAFGNGGDPQTLPTITKYVADPSPGVRAAAAQALRRIPGGEVDALLARLSADPVAEVRYQAVDAIHERTASPVLASALSALALADTNYGVRAASVNILAGWVFVLPELAGVLKTVLAQDPNGDLRNRAKNALAEL